MNYLIALISIVLLIILLINMCEENDFLAALSVVLGLVLIVLADRWYP